MADILFSMIPIEILCPSANSSGIKRIVSKFVVFKLSETK
jgi:hypothetical protein